MQFALSWMTQVLRDRGLKVGEHPNWTSSGHGDMKPIRGVLCHHTASAKGAKDTDVVESIVRGRPDLPGPDANLVLGRDGTFYCIAAGKAYHAGRGTWNGMPDSIWNSSLIGIEAINDGLSDDPWNPIQYDAYALGCAALVDYLKLPTIMVCGHKEYSLPHGRKIDPSFDMIKFRADVEKQRIHKR